MSQKKILLLEGIHPGAKKRLESEGFRVETEPHSLSGQQLVERAKGFQAVGIRSKTQLSADILRELRSLEVVGCFCIGTDQVDGLSANEMGVPVFNAPYSNTRSVAELVICELVALSRRLTDRSMQMHKGVWQKSAAGANEVRGKVLGIIGYGHIGTQVSILAESMGINVRYFDIVKKLPLGNARACDSLNELLSQSDFVTLHVPDTPQTQGLLGAHELASMKTGAYLINASRGSVVDIPALAQSLKKKHLAGAAIDVFPKEPASNNEAFISEIQELENVILTPHIGGSTEEAQEAIGQEVAESFRRYLRTGATSGAVNFPNLEVVEPKAVTRLIHIHKNVPGVLGAVNGVVSQLGVNIVAQHLATDQNIGYLIMDMGLKKPEDAQVLLKQVSQLKTSVRTGIL